MIKREMTIARLVDSADRCVAKHMHQINAAQGTDVARKLLAETLAIGLSKNLVYVNNKSTLTEVWEEIEEKSNAQLPLIDFINTIAMQFYMGFYGKDVLPEDVLAFGVGSLHPAGGDSVLDEELSEQLPREDALKKLYRDNRWFVILLLITMSDVVAQIPDDLATTTPKPED